MDNFKFRVNVVHRITYQCRMIFCYICIHVTCLNVSSYLDRQPDKYAGMLMAVCVRESDMASVGILRLRTISSTGPVSIPMGFVIVDA